MNQSDAGPGAGTIDQFGELEEYMRISVIGCGYLGAVHAAAMAELGHDVVGGGIDEDKIAALSTGRPPFFGPGLPAILSSAIASGRLRFTTDIAAV